MQLSNSPKTGYAAMSRGNRGTRGVRGNLFTAVLLAGLLGTATLRAFAREEKGRGSVEVPPDATPQILKITPERAAAGSEVTVQIEGQNFSAGAYVSFSTPAVRVISTQRLDAARLQSRLMINQATEPGPISLYVSNPAGPAAEASFTILEAVAPPPPPSSGPIAGTQSSKEIAPEVTAVIPPRAARGSQTKLKINGKRFAEGAKVSFSNRGIRVLETRVAKSSELTAEIQIASDAPTGETSLFVVNPDDTEVEARFEVTEAAGAAAGTIAAGSGKNVQAPQSFQVFNLGEGISILQNPAKSKGTLTLAAGKLKYVEEEKEVFSVPLAEIKEIAENSVFGVNTGTFHITLSSGKTYNFIAASLRPPDTQAMVDSLRRAIH